MLHLMLDIRHIANRRYSSAYAREIVTVEVGSSESTRAFHIHRGLLTFYSGYFKAALNGRFVEAQSGVIKLDTEEPAVFEEFVKWLYTHKPRTEKITYENRKQHYLSIVKLWIFADRRDVPLLMNEMIDSFQHDVVRVWAMPRDVLKEVYENTIEGSTLRRMIVDMYKSISGPMRQEYLDDFPKQFLFDWLNSQFGSGVQKHLSKEAYGKVDMCPFFHAHEEGVSCTRKEIKRYRNGTEK